MADDRNPLIIPERTYIPPQRCLKCGSGEFNRRRVQGVVISRCRKCGEEAQGGLPQMPQDPRVPYPPEQYVPTVRFEKSVRGDDQIVEVRRRPDNTQSFRKGAPIPEPGEDQ